MSEPRGLPRFFRVAVLVGLLALIVILANAPSIIRVAGVARDDGWTFAPRDGGWIVASVTARSGGAALLAKDDVIVAVNDDARAGIAGPAWQIQDLDRGQTYTLTVRRGEATVRTEITVDVRADRTFVPWVVIYLAAAVLCLAIALLLGVVRPEDPAVPYAYWCNVIMAFFLVSFALRVPQSVRHDWFVSLATLAFPIHMALGYLFLERFPRRFDRSAGWTWFTRFVVGYALVSWSTRNVATVLRLLDLDTRLAAATALAPFFRWHGAVGGTIDYAYVGISVGAQLAVMLSNYRRLTDVEDRARVRVLALGQAIQMAPQILVSLTVLATILTGGTPSAVYALFMRRFGNALILVSPIAFGYAIIRHRALGVRVALRIGIQYALASNALRTIVLLPMAWLVYTAATHPDRTVSELLFTGWARVNLAVAALGILLLRYRGQITAALDRRFFRGAYDQEAILGRLTNALKQADSLGDVARLTTVEVERALQVSDAYVLYRDSHAAQYSVSYASRTDVSRARPIDAESTLLRAIGRTTIAHTRDELSGQLSPADAKWLATLGAELVVPLTGLDAHVVGLLVLGPKRSEEIFTAKDRSLLQLIAAQIGSACEVLSLRERVGQQLAVQTEVLASVGAQHINLMKECPNCGRCFDRDVTTCPDDGEETVLTMPIERTLDGKYRLERLIGRGGMVAVYLAHDARLNRRVAIKVIKGSAFHSSSARRRFGREAQACAQLTHPRVISVFDYSASEHQAAYLVMEYVEGSSWRAELKELGAFTPTAAADLLEQICDGMEAAHQAGILHRDLKPDNFLIFGTPPRLQVKVLDFGLAKIRDAGVDDPKSMTVAGVAMGTLGYMSPEQLNAREVDERTDIYAVGVVALESLTGFLPAFTPDFQTVIEAEIERRLVNASTAQEVQHLAEVLRKALEHTRSRRYSSMSELRFALIPAIRACAHLSLVPEAGVPRSRQISGGGAAGPVSETRLVEGETQLDS